MKFYLMPMIIGLLVIVGPDVWIYRKIRKRIGNTYLRYVYWLPALFFVLFFCGMRLFSHDVPDYRLMSHITWILWLFALIYLPKLFYALFDIIGWILNGFSRKISLWLSRVGAGVAVVLAILLLYGALVGRTRVHVKQVEIAYDGLPRQLDGFKIVQLSDMHVGNWGDYTRGHAAGCPSCPGVSGRHDCLYR